MEVAGVRALLSEEWRNSRCKMQEWGRGGWQHRATLNVGAFSWAPRTTYSDRVALHPTHQCQRINCLCIVYLCSAVQLDESERSLRRALCPATHSRRSAGLVMITRLLAGYYTSGALSPRPADYYSCWSHSSINRHNSLPCPYSESVIRLRVARHAPTPRHADALHYFFAVTCENSWYAIKDRRSAKISL